MKKNLKKVISAVLALTLVMSSFVAMTTTSAATFSDVKETASYYEAVEALAALGVFTGYGDGTFLPDNKITRAEAITMIVNANAIVNASGAAQTTKFADVNANAAWAGFYVNEGVSRGFISGMSATEFGPSLNVNYVMVLTMLTKMLGYNDYAVARGGYPDGYMQAARQADIMTGVSAAETDELTRAQVAQLIWNAVKAPKVAATKLSTSTDGGDELEKMDGVSNPFETVLSDKFNAYVLNIEVTDTSKMQANSALELGNIEMKLTGANDYDPEAEVLVKNYATGQNAPATHNAVKKPVAVGKTAAEDYAFASAKVVATYDEDGEWALVYFAPTAKVATKAVDGTLASTIDTQRNELLIKNSATSSSTKAYKLAVDDTNTATVDEGAQLYVNGVWVMAVDGNETSVINLLNASVGDTVLYENKTTGRYDKIMIDVYALASVSQVKTSGDDVTIIFSATKNPATGYTNAPETRFTIVADDIADGVQVVTITKDGAQIPATSLKKNDVVAVKYDITKTTNPLASSRSVEIIATDAKVTGQYTSLLDNGNYLISGTEYALGNQVAVNATGLDAADALGKTFTLRLDPFGNLYAGEVEASTTLYAIVEKYYSIDFDGPKTGVDLDYIEVVTLDGKVETISIDERYEDSANTLMKAIGLADSSTGAGKLYSVVSQTAPSSRIISYTVNSKGYINEIKNEIGNVVALSNDKYNEATNVLKNRLTSDAVVLDATKYTSATTKSASLFKASSLSNLESTVPYNGFLVHPNAANAYAYVVITEAGRLYGTTPNFAVAAKDANSANVDYVDEYKVNYITVADLDGANVTKKLYVDPDAKVYYYDENLITPAYVTTSNAYSAKYSQIKEGTGFFYTTDSDGVVDRIDIVLEGTYTYATLLDPDTASDDQDVNDFVRLPENTSNGGNKTINAYDWAMEMDATWSSSADNEIQMFLAPVVYSSESTVTFGTLAADYVETATAKTKTFAINDDTKVYSYDLQKAGYPEEAFGYAGFYGIDVGEIVNTYGYAYFRNAQQGERDFANDIQMAFVIAVNGVVTNAVVFNNN